MLEIVLEVVMIVIFILALADAFNLYHKNKKKLLLLVLAFVYAFIFENFNMFFAKGSEGSYFYSPEFMLWVWQIPLFVALSWAVLIYTAMHISDMLKLKTLTKPFMDSLLIVMLYLTLNVIAVKQGLVTWIGFSQNMGWFGVPADQFIAGMFMILMFSFLFRYLSRTQGDMIDKTTRTEYYFLLPAFAYMAMLIMFSLVNLAEDLFGMTRSEELFLLWAIVIFFSAMLRTTEKRGAQVLATDNFTIFVVLLTRLLFYSYIGWSFMFSRVYNDNMVLIFILLVSVIAELLVYHSAFGHLGEQIKIKIGKEKYEEY